MEDDIRNRYPLFDISNTKTGFIVKIGKLQTWNVSFDSEQLHETLKKLDQEHDMYKLKLWFEERFENLTFEGRQVFVKANKIPTSYLIDEDDLTESLKRLKIMDKEASLITENPDKYTFCSFCDSAIPLDYVGEKVCGGICCRYCQDKGDKKWSSNN